MKILFVGESWIIHSTHMKGFDHFTEIKYGEGGKWFIEALESEGIEVEYMPTHIAVNKFPFELEELNEYDGVVFSDIGSNSILLTEDVFSKGQIQTNRLSLIKEYVEGGGGFAMMGGYMSFQGIDSKGRYANTPVGEILPVKLLNYDDRVEAPEGVTPYKVKKDHPIFTDVADDFPHFLGYNKILPKEGCEVIAEVGDGDVFIAAGEYGNGRTVAFASDVSPHWGTQSFLDWESYDKLFSNIAKWIAKEI